MSDMQRDQQQDKGTSAEDAKEDLELKDDDADQIRGGAIQKDRFNSIDKNAKL